MALFDWLEFLGGGSAGFLTDEKKTPGVAGAAEDFEAIFKGSFGITIGDAVAAFMGGGRFTHLYGDDFKFVWDWEAFLDKFGHGGILATFLLGLGGNSTIVVGADNTLKYGQITSVKRASSIDITGGPNFLSNWFSGHPTAQLFANEPRPLPQDQQEAIDVDQAAGKAAGLFTIAMLLVSLTVELGIKIWMAAGGGKDWKTTINAPAINVGPAGVTGLLKSADTFVSDRLAAFAFRSEKVGYDLRKAVKAVDTVKLELEAIKNRTEEVAKQSADALSTYKQQVAGQFAGVDLVTTFAELDISAGAKATKKAADAAERALQEIAAMTGAVSNVTPDEDGNIEFKSINNLSTIAASDMTLSAGGNMRLSATGAGPEFGNVRVSGTYGAMIDTGNASAYVGLNSTIDSNVVTVAAGGNGFLTLMGGSIDSGARQFMNNSGLMLKFGDNVTGPRVVLTETELELSIGPPDVGASIILTDASITIKVAEVSYKLTPVATSETVAEVNREVTPEGHMITAAETTENVGVAGITHETPINTIENEATTSQSDAVSEHSTEGPSNISGAIVLIN